ncbi:hypothetical protein [Actinopolymorpha pittospori]|uniref:Uncharacterized protein n=1 Tax=Actinopolymorpha pittospori TaxID=648752 RepID=A0A927RBF2_9ACTN|nr:hypothetical protein [Actinopolymorpha pittospori]MBE1608704.1 hypothetical protein [Actinopolymorpha pittospori]
MTAEAVPGTTVTSDEAALSSAELESPASTEANAAPRLRAREDTADSPVEEAQAPGPAVGRVRRFMAFFDPPEIVSERRPSLAEVVAYARRAPYAPDQGPRRTAGLGYAFVVAVPVYAVAYICAWICERPARLVSALMLVAAFCFTPAGLWARTALAEALRWSAQHLT